MVGAGRALSRACVPHPGEVLKRDSVDDEVESDDRAAATAQQASIESREEDER